MKTLPTLLLLLVCLNAGAQRVKLSPNTVHMNKWMVIDTSDYKSLKETINFLKKENDSLRKVINGVMPDASEGGIGVKTLLPYIEEVKDNVGFYVPPDITFPQSGAYVISPPQYDTVKVMVLVSDTAHLWNEELTLSHGKLKSDTVQYGYKTMVSYWQYAYAVRDNRSSTNAVLTIGNYLSMGVLFYLNPDRKTRLSENIVIWQVKYLNK